MWFWDIVMSGLEILAALFVVAIGLGVLLVIAFFIIDRVQTKDAVRRNYPVLGRFRHLFWEIYGQMALTAGLLDCSVHERMQRQFAMLEICHKAADGFQTVAIERDPLDRAHHRRAR